MSSVMFWHLMLQFRCDESKQDHLVRAKQTGGYPERMVGGNPMIPTTDRVLFADATLNEAANGSAHGPQSQLAALKSTANSSSSVSSYAGTKPLGGNVGFKDSHAVM